MTATINLLVCLDIYNEITAQTFRKRKTDFRVNHVRFCACVGASYIRIGAKIKTQRRRTQKEIIVNSKHSAMRQCQHISAIINDMTCGADDKAS